MKGKQKPNKNGEKSTLEMNSSTGTMAIVALAAVVVIVAGVVLSKKRQAMIARMRVRPFGAETIAGAAAMGPTIHDTHAAVNPPASHVSRRVFAV